MEKKNSDDEEYFEALINYTNMRLIKWCRVGDKAQFIPKGKVNDYVRYKDIVIHEIVKAGKTSYRVHIAKKALCIEDELLEKLIEAIKQNNLLLSRKTINANKMLARQVVFFSGDINKVSPYLLKIRYFYFITPSNEKGYLPVFFDSLQDCYFISEVNRSKCQELINNGEFIIVNKSPCHKNHIVKNWNAVNMNSLMPGNTKKRIPWKGSNII